MATVNEKMTAIADAIREKTGTTEPLSLDQMALEIATMENNGDSAERAYLDKVGLQRLWYNNVNKINQIVEEKAASKEHADSHLSYDTIEWDGDLSKYETVVEDTAWAEYGEFYYYVLVSEKEIVPADLVNNPIGDAFINQKVFIDYDVPTNFTAIRQNVRSDNSIEFLIEFNELPLYWGDSSQWIGMYMAIYAPTDNYRYFDFEYPDDWEILLPKKGLYFVKYSFDGDLAFCTKYLTIPGFQFGEGSDPVVPETRYHASESTKYGVATKDLYGHVKLAYIQDIPSIDITQDEWVWKDASGNEVNVYEYTANTAVGATYAAIQNVLLSMEFEGIYNDFDDIYSELDALKDYGLGTNVGKWADDLNTATEAGWYATGIDTLNRPSLVQYGAVLVMVRTAGTFAQLAIDVSSGIAAIRVYVNGGFKEWKYLNGREARTVTVNTSYVNSGSITAETSGNILKIGGYIETKVQQAGDGSDSHLICTIPNVKVNGNTYATVVDHSTGKPYNILLFYNGTNTVVKLEAASYALPAYKWLNFGIVGIIE